MWKKISKTFCVPNFKNLLIAPYLWYSPLCEGLVLSLELQKESSCRKTHSWSWTITYDLDKFSLIRSTSPKHQHSHTCNGSRTRCLVSLCTWELFSQFPVSHWPTPGSLGSCGPGTRSLLAWSRPARSASVSSLSSNPSSRTHCRCGLPHGFHWSGRQIRRHGQSWNLSRPSRPAVV